jgi:hypothetical protein
MTRMTRMIRWIAQRCRALLSGIVELIALYGALRLAHGLSHALIRLIFSN